MTPETEAAIRQYLGGDTPPSDPMVPDVPVQEDPTERLRAAERQLERAAAERAELVDPGAEGTQRGIELARRLTAGPEPIPEKPSLLESGARALLPHVVTRDQRPLSPVEQARLYATHKSTPEVLADALTAPKEIGTAMAGSETTFEVLKKLGLVPDVPYAESPGAKARDPMRNADEEGIATENAALYAMRLLTSTIPAVATETIERLPYPDLSRMVAARRAGDVGEAFQALVPRETLGEQLGIDPGATQRIRRDNPIADWAQGVLERIEDGRGLEGDIEHQFRTILGPEYAGLGWWVGAGLDMLTPWETLALAPVQKGVQVAGTKGRLEEITPETVTPERSALVDAVRGHETQYGESLGEAFAQEVEAGRASVDDAPPKMRAFLDQASMSMTGRSIGELSAMEGVGRQPGVGVDVAHQRNVQEAKAAQQEAGQAQAKALEEEASGRVDADEADIDIDAGIPGVTPDAFTPREGRLITPERSALAKGRPRLPPWPEHFPRQRSMATYWRNVQRVYEGEAGEVHPQGYNRPWHDGFYRMEDAAEQAVDDADYILRDANGDVKAGPAPYREIQEAALTRRTDGDVAWRGTQRIVARWGKTVRELTRTPPPEPVTRPGKTFAERFDDAWQAGREKSPVNLVTLDELRKAFPELDRKAFDDQLLKLRKDGSFVMSTHDGRHGKLTPEQKAAAIREGTRELPYVAERGDGSTKARIESRPKVVPDVVRPRRTGKREVAWVADHDFSSPVERALVREARRKDPRALPLTLHRRQRQVDQATADRQTIGSAIADAVTGNPAPLAGKPRANSMTAAVIREAARLAVRDVMGTDRLRALPGGAMIARHEWPRAIARIDQLLGMDATEAGKVIGGAPLRPEVEKALSRYLPDRQPGTTLTGQDWVRARRAAVKEAVGEIGLERYRVRGVLPLGERLLDATKDFHLDRTARNRIQRMVMENGPLAWIGEMFLEDRLAHVDPRARTVLETLRMGVARASEDLLDDVVKDLRAEGGGRDAAMHRLLGRLNPVPVEELDHATRVIAAPLSSRQWVGQLAQLRKEWRGPRPPWLDHEDPVISSYGLKRWSHETRGQAAGIGRSWLEANLVAANRKVSGTTIADALEQLTDEVGEAIYREIAAGQTRGKALQRALDDLGYPDLPPERDALRVWATNTMVTHRVQAAVDELVGAGFLVRANDPRRPALEAALQGRLKSWDAANRRWDYKYTEAQSGWALEQLRTWGLEPGAQTSLKTKDLGGQRVVLPAFLAEELASLERSGVWDSRSLAPSKVEIGGTVVDLKYPSGLYNWAMRWFKTGVLHGIIFPNPAHFLGQMLGAMPTLVNSRGFGGAASTVGRLLYTSPVIVGELVRRVGGVGLPVFKPRSPEAGVLRTQAGDLIDIDELEQAARGAGFSESRVDFETAAGFETILRHEENLTGGTWQRIKATPRWWQEQLRRFASAMDVNLRMADFVEQVARGVPVQEAAIRARDAVLDYRAMTRFESRWMRNVFTFYAFMRKSADSHLKALFLNPERVIGQMRMATAAQQTGGLTQIELGNMREEDLGRLSVLDDDRVYDDNGRVHPLYRMVRFTTTPMGTVEWLTSMRSLMLGAEITPDGGVQLNPEMTLQGMTPLLQTMALLTQGRRLEREIDSPWSNRIPPVILDMPGGDYARTLFGVGPLTLGPNDDPLIADEDATNANGGVPAVWAAGEAFELTDAQRVAKRLLWQQSQVWLSRPIGNQARLSQAGLNPFGSAPPEPYVTQWETTMSYLLGLTPRPVFDEQEQIRQSLRRRAQRIETEAENRQLPRGVGPR